MNIFQHLQKWLQENLMYEITAKTLTSFKVKRNNYIF